MTDNSLYDAISAELVTEIKAIWKDEESMSLAYADLLHAEKTLFDRTDHAANLLRKILEKVWKNHVTDYSPVAYDIEEITGRLLHLLDYNLFTQVYPNLRAFTLRYDSSAADKEVARALEMLPEELKKDFSNPKTKYATEEKIPDGMTRGYYNTVIAASKMGSLNPFTSFRISPVGSTPAFADSSNFSGFSIYLDQFLESSDPNRRIAVLRWTNGEVIDLSTGAESEPGVGVVTHFAGIDEPIVSKSGGPILSQVMFARKMMRDFLLEFGNEYQVWPRLFSLTVSYREKPQILDVFNDWFHRYLAGSLTEADNFKFRERLA